MLSGVLYAQTSSSAAGTRRAAPVPIHLRFAPAHMPSRAAGTARLAASLSQEPSPGYGTPQRHRYMAHHLPKALNHTNSANPYQRRSAIPTTMTASTRPGRRAIWERRCNFWGLCGVKTTTQCANLSKRARRGRQQGRAWSGFGAFGKHKGRAGGPLAARFGMGAEA